MTYQEALAYVHSICWRGSRPGLSRITELLHRLQNPQESLRCIHVAGTNGKGSVCAMLSSILRAEGYRVGLFVSPFLRDFKERIQFNGQPIPAARFAEITAQVRPLAETMEDPPTEFELITAIGFLYFAQENCDFVILEAGMGGRLDSTNVISSPVLSVVTGVDFDHMAFLGNTLSQIAFEKAGIFKKGCPAVFGGGAPEAEAVIRQEAEKKQAPLWVADRARLQAIDAGLSGITFDFIPWQRLHLALLGIYQPENAAIALTAVEVLRAHNVTISDDAVRRGMAQVVWPARFELVSETPTVIFDGGHNAQGVAACIRSMCRYFPDEKVCILSGVMQDKAYQTMAEEIAQIARSVYTVTPGNPRALDAEAYAAVFRNLHVPAQAFDSVETGVAAAYRAAKEQNCPLLILGSLYAYGDVMDALEALKKAENG